VNERLLTACEVAEVDPTESTKTDAEDPAGIIQGSRSQPGSIGKRVAASAGRRCCGTSPATDRKTRSRDCSRLQAVWGESMYPRPASSGHIQVVGVWVRFRVRDCPGGWLLGASRALFSKSQGFGLAPSPGQAPLGRPMPTTNRHATDIPLSTISGGEPAVHSDAGGRRPLPPPAYPTIKGAPEGHLRFTFSEHTAGTTRRGK